jgi:hypothetical protein
MRGVGLPDVVGTFALRQPDGFSRGARGMISAKSSLPKGGKGVDPHRDLRAPVRHSPEGIPDEYPRRILL